MPPRRPVRVVLDSHLRLPLASRLVRSAKQSPVLVYASEQAPKAEEQALVDQAVTVVRLGQERVNISALLADLGSREITSVLVEGGGAILGSFLAGGFADKLALFVAPRLLGGRESIPAFGGESPVRLDQATDLVDLEVGKMGNAWVVTGYPRRFAQAG